MKSIKVLLSFVLSIMLVTTSMLTVFAVSDSNSDPSVSSDKGNDIMYINWSSSVYLTTYSWNNITGSNNVFTEYINVTNHGNNNGAVWIRVLDGYGNVICGPTYIAAGTTGTLGPIPYNSGTYTIQGKAYSVSDDYYLNIRTYS